MSILTNLNLIANKSELFIDTIRSDFCVNVTVKSKTKMELLNEIGKWQKVTPRHKDYESLKHFLDADKIEHCYKLKNERMYYFRHKGNAHKVTLCCYGLKQYHHEPTDRNLLSKILEIANNVNSIDLCKDNQEIFNYDNLAKHYTLKSYKEQTYYINNPNSLFVDKYCFYNKALKNELMANLWRCEATIKLNIKSDFLNHKKNLQTMKAQLNSAIAEFETVYQIATARKKYLLSRHKDQKPNI